ncbi:MAG: hypothetical protein WC009_03615 [Methylotenera sp.]
MNSNKSLLTKGSTSRVSERDEVQGARCAETEIVRGVQRGCEHRATKQFACVAAHEVLPKILNKN